MPSESNENKLDKSRDLFKLIKYRDEKKRAYNQAKLFVIKAVNNRNLGLTVTAKIAKKNEHKTNTENMEKRAGDLKGFFLSVMTLGVN